MRLLATVTALRCNQLLFVQSRQYKDKHQKEAPSVHQSITSDCSVLAAMNGNFLITGAAGGFGKEFSRRVLENGGRVVLTDKNNQAGREVCQALQQVNHIVLHSRQHPDIPSFPHQTFGEDSCTFEEHDVTDKAQWEQVWSAAEKFFKKPLDVLVNNAGVSPMLGFDLCMKVDVP